MRLGVHLLDQIKHRVKHRGQKTIRYWVLVFTMVASAYNFSWTTKVYAQALHTSEVTYPLQGKAVIKKDSKTGEHSAVLSRKIKHPLEKVYTVLTDYEHFPEYMPHTKKTKVTKVDGELKWVDYTLVFLVWFEVEYTLRLFHQKQQNAAKISWTFEKGDYFEDIKGHWYLKRLAQEGGDFWTGVSYVSVIDPKVTIPRAIFDRLTKKSVYELFDAVTKRLSSTGDKKDIKVDKK